MEIQDTLRRLFAWLGSDRGIAWLFASCVFGAYVVSLEAALLESVGCYGPMRVFTTGGLANMVLPIEFSIFAWILVSFLNLVGHFAIKPIPSHRGVLAGIISLALSVVT